MTTLVRAVALSLVVLLASCGGTGGNPVEPTSTVVLVYVIGSTLESDPDANASINLKEMMKAGPLTNTTVVVQTGGAAKTGKPPVDPLAMQPENIDWTRLQRYVVHPTSLEQVVDLGPEGTDNPSLNMASSVAFLEFMDWAVDTFPAGRYLVVLWDHGGGINRGIGRDENTSWVLSVADIGMVLQTAVAGRKASIELTGFDACLMANAEVAAALARSSRYMVASQDLEPGSGWDYTSFLRYVDDNPGANGAGIGSAIVQGYVTKQVAEGNEDLTMSVVDLQDAAAMQYLMGNFASTLQAYALHQDGWNEIAKGRVRTLDWLTTPLKGKSLDLADLKGFITNVVAQIVTNLGPDETLELYARQLLEAIDESVKTNAALGSNARATGLSVFFPSVLAAFPTKNYALNTSMGRIPFFVPLYTGDQFGLVQTYFDFYLAHESELKATVTLTGDPAAPLSALVQNDFEFAMVGHEAPSCTVVEDKRPRVVPCFDSFRFPDEATRLPGGHTWRIDTSPATAWPALADGSGHVIPVALLPDTYGGKVWGTVNDYVVPVHLQPAAMDPEPPKLGDLTVREVIPASGAAATYEVTGFRLDDDAPGRERPLVDGEVYTVRVYATLDGTKGWYETDRTLTVSGGTLTLGFVPAGAGRLGYFVTDLTGAVQTSALADYVPAR